MIAIRTVTKHYGTRCALDGVSFTARDGAITGLLGPNGAGKTTTFRIAAGLVKADIGNVEIDGSDRRDTLGVLPHVRGLYGRLTVREHIRYFGALRGLRGRGLETQVEELIQQLGLGLEASRQARTLSE